MYGNRKRVCTESRLWEKIPCRTGESNLRRQRAGPMLYQLSYIPTHYVLTVLVIITTAATCTTAVRPSLQILLLLLLLLYVLP